jgi:ABC-2 type transport system ATP-binding protein
VIKAEQLTRRYGDFLAVDRVDFSIGQGEIVGLLGHNGAGKTTIMKMLTGYLEPSAGRIFVDGVDVAEQPKVVQRSLGYLSESLPLYPEMTVVDYLEYAAELRGVVPADQANAVRESIEATELEGKAFDAIHTLSRGYRQRVGVAQAILHKPRFLVLDEPTNGLDPSQTQHMRELIRRLAGNATIILSTHIMQEVNAVCDRAMILRNGRLVLDESLAALRRSERLLVGTDAAPEAVGMAVRGIDGVGTALPVRNGVRRVALPLSGRVLSGDVEATAARVVAALVAANIHVFSVAPEQRDLETVFREVSDAGEAA